MRIIKRNRYEMKDILGSGAGGTVYTAYDLHLERMVAIKERNLGDSVLLEEAGMLKQLRIAGVPMIYDYFEEDGKACLVMEYVEGISLKDKVRRDGPYKEAEAVVLMQKVLAILQELHSLQPLVIYRDLKPEHILLLPDESVRLVDLGAAAAGYTYHDCTQCTPAYGAPEQFEEGRRQSVDVQTDLFALGKVFYFALTGRTEVSKSGLSVKALRPECHDGTENFIRSATNPNRRHRMQSDEEASYRLQHYQYGINGPRIRTMLWNILFGCCFGLGSYFLFTLQLPQMCVFLSLAVVTHLLAGHGSQQISAMERERLLLSEVKGK